MLKHRQEYRVRYGDTDAAGVVYNANYLRLFEIGRSEFMREHVCSYKEIEESGVYLPVTESFCRYKAPAHYDDVLIIESKITERTRLTCKFSHRILRMEGEREKLLAKGYTIHAPVDKNGKLTALPELMASKIAAIVAGESPV